MSAGSPAIRRSATRAAKYSVSKREDTAWAAPFGRFEIRWAGPHGIFRQRDAHQRPLLGHPFHAQARQGANVGDDVDPVEAAQELPERREPAGLFAHRADQSRLRTEVPEQGRFVDAGAFGDLSRRRSTSAVAFEDLARGRQNAGARFFNAGVGSLRRDHQFFAKTASSNATLVR